MARPAPAPVVAVVWGEEVLVAGDVVPTEVVVANPVVEAVKVVVVAVVEVAVLPVVALDCICVVPVVAGAVELVGRQSVQLKISTREPLVFPPAKMTRLPIAVAAKPPRAAERVAVCQVPDVALKMSTVLKGEPPI